MSMVNFLAMEQKQSNCVEHGDFTSLSFVKGRWTTCPVCAEAKVAEIDSERAAQEKRAAWERRVGQSCIPTRFAKRTLSSFVVSNAGQGRAKAFAVAYAEGFDDVLKSGRSAIFSGNPGTGKTHLAAGIGLHIMAKGKTFLFSSAASLVRRVKDTYSKGSAETESEAIRFFCTPDLLVIDEVGQQFGSDTEKLVLFEVINRRYENCQPTILMSNLPVEDYKIRGEVRPGIRSYLGDRVIDRMREGGGQLIIFDWESQRGNAAGEEEK